MVAKNHENLFKEKSIIQIMLEQKEIEKPWCVYGFIGPWGFGKIERESEHSIEVRYSEGQIYRPKIWDSKKVKRFSTLEEAVDHYIESRSAVDTRWGGDISDNEVRKNAKINFPSYFKDKKEPTTPN